MAISRQRPLKVQIGHSISLLPPGLDGNGIQVGRQVLWELVVWRYVIRL